MTEARVRHASKHLLFEDRLGASLDRAAIEAHLPHRDPFLLLDAVDALDPERRLICARRWLSADDPVLAGHFPEAPVWPGVLQIEAIGQAGVLLYQVLSSARGAPVDVALTGVDGARFVRPVRPPATIEIVASVEEDGLFFSVLGQCLVNGQIVCAAAASGLLPVPS